MSEDFDNLPEGWDEQEGMPLVEITYKRFQQERRRGYPRKFDGPHDLLAGVLTYFRWLENNPHQESKLASYQGDHQILTVPKMRVATLRGLCLHLGIAYDTWLNWRGSRGDNIARNDLIPVIEYAEGYIYEHKYNGAAAGFLNPMIIARDLGLSEKNELSGPNGKPLETVVQYQLPDNGRNKESSE